MTSILPIPIGRTSDVLVSTRLRQQLQFDQLSLLRVQTQVSTGRRVINPSEDAPAALRGITLQRLLEQKSQVRTNLETSRSYLSATENALANVSQILSDVRGEALAAADTTRSDSDRLAAGQTVDAAIQQLLDVANHQFRGRHLFAGSETTTRPFIREGNFIRYAGNERALQSYSDIDLLFETNRTGDEVFGGISSDVRGTVDFNPILTEATKLNDLHGGRGIRVGSFTISDGLNSNTIDISGAETIGDLINRIEANPPAGNGVIARVTPTGLEISLTVPGNLTISEVGSGTTASELGILEADGGGLAPVVGEDLNPRTRLTTPLDDLLGIRARALIESPGSNNNIVLTANNRGAEFNGYRVQFIDDAALQAAPGLTPGNEVAHLGNETTLHARASLALLGPDNDLVLTAVDPGSDLNHVTIEIEAVNGLGNAANAIFDAGTNTLTLQIDDADATQLDTLIAEIDATGLFTAAADPSAGEGYVGTGTVAAANAGVVVGNTSGSGGDEQTIFVQINSGVTTAAQVVAALNSDPTVSALFTASLDEKELPTNAIPGSAPVEETAAGLTSLGSGVEFDSDAGIQITSGGETYVIDVSTAETVEDLLNLFNGSAANVAASLKADGTGIDIRSRLSGVDFSIGENGGLTATQLGVRSFNDQTLLDDLNHGRGVHSIDGTDFTIRRNDGTELEIDISDLVTIGDLLSAINDHPDNQDADAVVARLTEFGNGIELVDDNPTGADPLTIIRRQGSEAAWELGLIPTGDDEAAAGQLSAPATAAVDTGALNTAFTIEANVSGTLRNDIEIIFDDSLLGDLATATFDQTAGTLTIALDAAQTTANTVIQAINDQGIFAASLDASTDTTNDGTGLIAGSIGTFPSTVGTTNGGRADSLATEDTNPLETKSVFNTLLRLSNALKSNDYREIERSVAALDVDLDRVNFVRGDLGAKEQSLDTLTQRLDNEEVELRETLSLEIEVDLVAAISELTQRQAAAEASLQVMARVSQLTLLNFL